MSLERQYGNSCLLRFPDKKPFGEPFFFSYKILQSKKIKGK